jgi:hypothetical protein
MLEHQIIDYRKKIVALCYSPDFEAKKEAFLSGAAVEFLTQMDGFLSRNGGPFLMGNVATLPDFLLHEMVDLTKAISPGISVPFGWVNIFMASFESLPGVIATHLRNAGLPFNNVMASFK